MGYDGEIGDDFLQSMPEDLRQQVEDLADGAPPRFLHLMSTAEGRQWWRENGSDVDVSFPLGDKPDNLSRQVLMGYVEEKAKRAGKPVGEFLSKLGSKPTPKKKNKKGDGLHLSEDDDKILDTVWGRIRKQLEDKKKRQKRRT